MNLEELKSKMGHGPFQASFEDIELLQKLMAVAQAVKRMREAALKEGDWYTFLPCEYAEDVDEALDGVELE